MTETRQIGRTIGRGIAAGLAGTGAMMAMRFFDEKYAPDTVPKTREDPGQFMVRAAERVLPSSSALPKTAFKAAAYVTHAGYGTLFGVLYALVHGRGRRRSALGDGLPLGVIVYAISYFGWLAALGLSKPVWKQKFPQIAGEILRHAVYGVATVAVFSFIEGLTTDHWHRKELDR